MAKNFMSPVELERLWDLYAAGDTVATIARKLGRPFATVNGRIQQSGGIRPGDPDTAAAGVVARGA